MSLKEVQKLLREMSPGDRSRVLRTLRDEHKVPIHPIEAAWSTTAEAILEAIHASPDLTQRGVRGVLAEAIFRTVVVPSMGRWTSIAFEGDHPYDLLMDDGHGRLKVQVKNQRRKGGIPLIDARLSKIVGSDVFVVETQRTRTGKRTTAEGEPSQTRPYRFVDFDILAVCLQPHSKKWDDFIYCPTRKLAARKDDSSLLAVMQPIVHADGGPWTKDFDAAAEGARTS